MGAGAVQEWSAGVRGWSFIAQRERMHRLNKKMQNANKKVLKLYKKMHKFYAKMHKLNRNMQILYKKMHKVHQKMPKLYKKMPRVNKKVSQADNLKHRGPGPLIMSFTCSSGHARVCFRKVCVLSLGQGHWLVQEMRKVPWSPGFLPLAVPQWGEAGWDEFLEH